MNYWECYFNLHRKLLYFLLSKVMEKDQAGKSDNYPTHRKPYSSGKIGTICKRRQKVSAFNLFIELNLEAKNGNSYFLWK